MQDKAIFNEPLLVRAEEYGKTSLELLKLKVVGKSAELVSTFISRVTIILIFAMFLGIATIGVSLWIGDLLGKAYYGFFCVAGFYAILGSVLQFLMNRTLKKRITDSIISQFLN
jgi:hypothetical protein